MSTPLTSNWRSAARTTLSAVSPVASESTKMARGDSAMADQHGKAGARWQGAAGREEPRLARPALAPAVPILGAGQVEVPEKLLARPLGEGQEAHGAHLAAQTLPGGGVAEGPGDLGTL